jgi:hypothetical protein
MPHRRFCRAQSGQQSVSEPPTQFCGASGALWNWSGSLVRGVIEVEGRLYLQQQCAVRPPRGAL